MDSIRIVGGAPLKGTVAIAGAKNAALPLMAASLLTDEPLILSNIPHLSDVTSLATLLGGLGVSVALAGENPTLTAHDPHHKAHQGRVLTLQAKNLTKIEAVYELVRKMRASILVLGPILARTGEAIVSLPGGCAIGTRPVDIHLKGLTQLGADITLENGYIHALAPHGLRGADFTFPMITVTGTENLLMAACLARGTTRLINAAREPEVTDLAHCLQKMGAQIEGIGTDTLIIEGQERLNGAHHRILPDRIEAGTYAIAAAITGGDLTLEGIDRSLLAGFLNLFSDSGAHVEDVPNGIRFWASRDDLRGVDITTDPFPGFPTDLQAQMMALMCISKGASLITETIFENRFMHVPELLRMGANIAPHGASMMVRGQPTLRGAPVMATDLRASVSLILAGLVAEGETTIGRVYHLDRGYEYIESKLKACGAIIERVSNTQDKPEA